MMILILMMAAAVSCSSLSPMLQVPSGGMPEGMEFCKQGRIKKLCHKGVFQPTAVKGPVALAFCPGTLKKLCPIKPVALRFTSGPVTSIPVGWKICRDNLGLCPVSGYSTRRRPTMSRPSYPSAFANLHNKGMVPCKYRAGMCFPESDDDDSSMSRPSFPGAERHSMPLDSRVGRPSKRPIYFPSAFPTHHNKGMVPCKYRAGMCFPESDDDDSSESGFVESQPTTRNKGMVPCKDSMGMCFPDN